MPEPPQLQLSDRGRSPRGCGSRFDARLQLVEQYRVDREMLAQRVAVEPYERPPLVGGEIEAGEVVFAIGKKGGARRGIVDDGKDRSRQFAALRCGRRVVRARGPDRREVGPAE